VEKLHAPTAITRNPFLDAPAAQPVMHEMKVPVGIPGAALAEAPRLAAADEPPPLPPNSAPNSRGTPPPRTDGRPKVTGAEHVPASGGAILVPETELGRVPELVRSLLDDPRRLEAMGKAMASVARPDAGARIAEELIEGASDLITWRTLRSVAPAAVYMLVYVADLYLIARAVGVHRVSFLDEAIDLGVELCGVKEQRVVGVLAMIDGGPFAQALGQRRDLHGLVDDEGGRNQGAVDQVLDWLDRDP